MSEPHTDDAGRNICGAQGSKHCIMIDLSLFRGDQACGFHIIASGAPAASRREVGDPRKPAVMPEHGTIDRLQFTVSGGFGGSWRES